MKKNLALKAFLLLVIVLLFPAAGSAADNDLTAQQKFDALKEKGIFAGMADGSAGLDRTMNRAQFARVSALILGLDGIGDPDTKVVTEKPFSDVELGMWYTEEIAAVKEAGVFVGNGDGIFSPDGDVTVQQLAVVVAGILNLDPVADASVEGAADWAAGYIQAILDNGITFPTNYTEPATRAQLVEISSITEAVVSERNNEEETANEEEVDEVDEQEEAEEIVEEPSTTPSPSPPPPSPSTTALRLINAAASSGSWTAVDETTFITAGVTNVTAANVVDVIDTLVTDGRASWTAAQIQAIVDAITAKQAALDVINAAAEAGDWTAVDESTFTTAGVTDVTADNAADVIDALVTDGRTSWTAAQIQAIVDAITAKQAALDVINAAAEAGDWTAVDESTFTTAGVTDVTADNAADVIDALVTDGRTSWTAAEIQSVVDGVSSGGLTEQEALDLINTAAAAANPEAWTGIDETTFAAAGITGITNEYLTGIQGVLQDYDYPLPAEPKDKAQIQTIVNEMINLDLINDYFGYGYGTEPTTVTFELAGLIGVNDLNLADIIAHLHTAYGGGSGGEPFPGGGDPFPGGGEPFPGGPGGSGGSLYPGSSKQEIQQVIDDFLASWVV